jgi:hypothetical protein
VTGPGREPARRLVFAVDELAELRALAGGPPLPPDFEVTSPAARMRGRKPTGSLGGGAVESTVVDRLAARGLVVVAAGGGRQPHPSLLADLAVLAGPELLVRVRGNAGRRGLRAVYAVAGPLGVGLLRPTEGAGVEWSAYPAESLGAELARAVSALGVGPDRGGARPTGLVPLAALVELPIAADLGAPGGELGAEIAAEVAAELGVSGAQRDLALRLAGQSTGVLEVTVTAPDPAGAGRSGRVVWVATPAGWVGLAPEPAAGPGRPVRLTPVEDTDIGGWLAPLVGQLVGAGR